MKSLIFLFPLIFLLSCANSRKDNPNSPSMNYDQISFEFRDASVPPQYHRSYTIDVSKEESRVVVDSYGDVLAEQTEAITPETWGNLQKAAAGLQKAGSFTAEGATGTKGFTLALYVKGEKVYELYWDSLSRDKAEQSAKDLREAVKATQPKLSELTR